MKPAVAHRSRHQPTRTCVGCRQRDVKSRLLRVVSAPQGGVVADPAQCLPGRGAYLHPREECEAQAIPRGIARALRREVGPSNAEALRLAAHQARKRPVAALNEGQS